MLDNNHVAKAIQRLSVKESGSFELLVEYLRKQLVDCDENNRVANEPESIYRNQGRAITLKTLIDELTDPAQLMQQD